MFSPIPEILEELRQGRMIVLTDDEDRENEGDLVLPAQFVSPQALGFMLSAARGYLCLALTEEDCDRLELTPQAGVNSSVRGTAFTVSIDGHPRHGFTTGVSAAERARCVALAIDPASRPVDFVRPGHINPLRARNGGVLVRTGQTEGSVDLCRLAGLHPSALIIEILREDGEMARRPDLKTFCARHSLKACSIAQIIEHRLAHESLVRRLPGRRTLRTPWGPFELSLFSSLVEPWPHFVLSLGELNSDPTLVRVHRQNLLGDLFEDGGDTASGRALRGAMELIARQGRGAAVYLRNAHTLADEGFAKDALPPMDRHEFGIGGQILRALGLSRLRLITSSNRDLPGLEAFGLSIAERVSLPNQPGVAAAHGDDLAHRWE